MNLHPLAPIAARCLLVALVWATFFALPPSAMAVVINGYANMGASESASTAYSSSWVPFLHNLRSFNFGPGQTYNEAIGGATSSSLLTQNQHTKVAAEVQNGNVDLSYLFIGGNDFNGAASAIADGSLTGPALTAAATSVVANIETAMDTVLAESPLGMIVVGLPDLLLTPGGRALFNTAPEQVRGNAAINEVNAIMLPQVLDRGQVFVDAAGSIRALNQSGLVVGGLPIDLVNPGASPTFFFKDSVHPNAIGNGVIANLMLVAVNKGYGTNYPLLTDLEILTAAGMAAQYTGETSQVAYADFVILPVPEPSSWALLVVGAGLLAAWRAGRRNRGLHAS